VSLRKKNTKQTTFTDGIFQASIELSLDSEKTSPFFEFYLSLIFRPKKEKKHSCPRFQEMERFSLNNFESNYRSATLISVSTI